MGIRILNIILVSLILFSGEAFTQNASPDSVVINTSSSVSYPSVGDSLTIFLDISVPAPFSIGNFPVSIDNTGLVVDSQDYTRLELNTGGHFDRYSLHAFVVTRDTLTVGPFSIEYTRPDSTTGIAVSNTLELPVNSVLTITDPNKPPAPNPNRPPVAIKKQGISIWIYAIVILVIILIIALFVYYRKRSNQSTTAIADIDKTIDEREEFEKIRRLKLHEKGELRELYIRVSDALRGFLHRQLPFEALYDTTHEILFELDRHIDDKETYALFKDILLESDMVKFAKHLPDAGQSSTIIDRALKPVTLVLEEKERERRRLEREEFEKDASESTETHGGSES